MSKIDAHSDCGKTDSCSPLCFCQCCQVNIDISSRYLFELIPKVKFTSKFLYNDDAIQNVIYTILQPPQLVNSIS